MGKEGRVKVADFGLARDLTECEYYRKTGDGKVGEVGRKNWRKEGGGKEEKLYRDGRL